jgi:hypothetical protein
METPRHTAIKPICTRAFCGRRRCRIAGNFRRTGFRFRLSPDRNGVAEGAAKICSNSETMIGRPCPGAVTISAHTTVGRGKDVTPVRISLCR